MDKKNVNKPKVDDARKKKKTRIWLLILFMVTGSVSLGIWWRGRVVHGITGIKKIMDPLEISFVVEPTMTLEDDLQKKTDKFVSRIGNLTSTASGEYAFYVFRLKSGRGYGLNEIHIMPAASIMKVPVIITVQEAVANGRMNLTDTYTLEEADRSTGSGPLQYKLAGTTYPVGDLLNYLGKNSDNTAWVMFNRRLGIDTFEDTLKEMDMTDSSYTNLTTTAKDVARMFAYIYEGKPGGDAGKAAIRGYLTDSIYEDRISVGIPVDTELVHKVGTDDGVWSDAGIIMPKSGKIEPFILVILSKGVDRNQAIDIVPEITRRVWDFENETGVL